MNGAGAEDERVVRVDNMWTAGEVDALHDPILVPAKLLVPIQVHRSHTEPKLSRKANEALQRAKDVFDNYLAHAEYAPPLADLISHDTDDYNTHIFHSDEYIHQLAHDSGFEVHSIYHWGPPILFNAGYWFKEQSLQVLIINFFIRCLGVASKFLPLYRIGHRKWSAHRAFILVKK